MKCFWTIPPLQIGQVRAPSSVLRLRACCVTHIWLGKLKKRRIILAVALNIGLLHYLWRLDAFGLNYLVEQTPFIEEKVNPKKIELYEKLNYEITWVQENKLNGDGSLINVILDKWKNYIQYYKWNNQDLFHHTTPGNISYDMLYTSWWSPFL